jgi:hypothetical protein
MLLAKIPREDEISHNVDSRLKLGVNATEVFNCTAVRKILVDTDGPNCLGYKIDEKGDSYLMIIEEREVSSSPSLDG